MKFISVIFLLIFLVPSYLIAQSQESIIDIDRLPKSFVFDGKLQEDFWSEMKTYTTVQHVPYNGKAVSEAEKIYLAYDKKFLYLAAKITGDDIQSPSKKRDEFSLTPDYIGIILDGYNDRENGLGFFTTPAGLRSDFTVFEDAVGDYPINNDWNTYWDVKTSRQEKSWSVEMRIPFSSLQFQSVDGSVEMGLIIWRAIASKNEISTFPFIKNQWGDWSSFKPSMTQKIRLKDINNSKPIYVTPYALAGIDRILEENTPYNATVSQQLAAGVDIKYSITSNITADFTVNTDFAQVEADDAQVNLDRFNLFFPEKRQFFQERASIFDLRVGGPNRIFYSRRIGIDENGNLEKILGGVRVTGRLGDYDVGFINMATRNDKWSLKNNFTVARLRKKVYNSNSYIGVLATNKTDFKGDYNSVYALDGTFRLPGNNLFQVRFAQSYTKDYKNKVFSLDPTRFIINLERVQVNGFRYDLAYNRMGKDYNPELGFEDRDDYTSIFGILGYGWQRNEQSSILQEGITMYNFSFVDHASNKDETSNVGLEYTVEWKNGFSFFTFGYYRRERLFQSTQIINDFVVDEGLYKIGVVASGFSTPSARKLQYSLNARGGDIFSSKFIAIRQSVDWVVIPDLTLGLFYNYNPIFLDGWDSEDIVHVHLARLKFLYTLSTKVSMSGFIQATSSGDLGLGNVRLRYNPREGVDLFLVYNNVTDLHRTFRENDYQHSTLQQVLIAKLTYTFRL